MEDSVIETITDLNRICRTCLNGKNLDDLRSLFENTLDEMLNGLASVKINIDDGLPNSVCSNCAFQLKLSYSFMQQCQRSDSQLRTALGLPEESFDKLEKKEPDEKKQFDEIEDEIEEEKSDDRRKIRRVRKVKVQESSDTDSEIADDPLGEEDIKCESKIEQRDGTKLFSFCLCNKEYEEHIRIEAGVAPRPEKHREVDLKDGEYGYKIYYDDGDYDFDDDSSQDEQEKNDGLCMIVNQTNREVQQRNNKALEKMEKYMEIYVLANSLRDYAQDVKKTMNDSSTNLTKEVDDAVESAQRDHIDIEDLTYLYKTLVAIPDSDKAFKNGTDWKKFVIFQLESVKDYIGEHFQYFKKELPKFRTSRQFYKRRNFYVKLGDRGGLMSIFYYWFDSRVCKPRMFDEAQIREKLKEHLKYVIDLPEHENATESEKNATKPAKQSGTLSGEGKDDGKGAADKPADDTPADDKAGDEKSEGEKSDDDKPAEDKPDEEKSEDEKAEDDKPDDEKPAEDKPAEENAADEKAEDEKAADEPPADEKSEDEKPAEDKPAEENAADEKPADEKTEEEVRTSAGPGGKEEK